MKNTLNGVLFPHKSALKSNFNDSKIMQNLSQNPSFLGNMFEKSPIADEFQRSSHCDKEKSVFEYYKEYKNLFKNPKLAYDPQNVVMPQHILECFMNAKKIIPIDDKMGEENYSFSKDGVHLDILKNGETGNLYLQNGDKNGFLKNGIRYFNITFDDKIEPQDYKKIFGHSGRHLDLDSMKSVENLDMRHLTKYITEKMTDDELIKTFKATMPVWDNLDCIKDYEAKSVLATLVDVLKNRGIAFDFKNSKFATESGDEIDKWLKREGVKICPYYFGYIGMKSASRLSYTLEPKKFLVPTESDTKKLNILEEATKVIAEGGERIFVLKASRCLDNIKNIFDIGKMAEVRDCEYGFGAIERSIGTTPLLGEIQKRLSNKYPDVIPSFTRYIEVATKKEISEIAKAYEFEMQRAIKYEKNPKVLNNMLKSWQRCSFIDEKLKERIRNALNTRIIKGNDTEKPRYITKFNKDDEKQIVHAEAIIDWENEEYLGHYVDKNYLDNANFTEILATWLHEICHRYGNDGTRQFTYKLTDLLENMLTLICGDDVTRNKIRALEKIYNEI